MQPVQDLTIDSTVGKAQYLFFLENPNQSTIRGLGRRGSSSACGRRRCSRTSRAISSSSGRQLMMTIDRGTAARFGITPATVDNALYDAFGQRIASTYYTQTNQYRVILNSDLAISRASAEALDGIYLPSATATTGQTPLSAIVSCPESDGAVADRASRPVPLGFDLLQSRAGRFARQRGRRHPSRPRPTSDCRRASTPPTRAPSRRSRSRCRTN